MLNYSLLNEQMYRTVLGNFQTEGYFEKKGLLAATDVSDQF